MAKPPLIINRERQAKESLPPMPESSTHQHAPSKRQIWLDSFRSLVVIAVIVAHGAQAYSHRFSIFAFVSASHKTALADWIYLFLNPLNMPFLFLISGYFVQASAANRPWYRYYGRRLIRLGFPFGMGVCVISPVLRYLYLRARTGYDAPFLDFWRHDYWGDYLSSASYWTLSYLLVLTGLALMGRGVLKTLSRYRYPPVMVGLLAIGTLFLGYVVWGSFYWISFLGLIEIQGSRVLLLAFCFFGGIIFYHQQQNTDNPHPPMDDVRGLAFCGAAMVAGVCYALWMMHIWIHDRGLPLYQLDLLTGDERPLQWATALGRSISHGIYGMVSLGALTYLCRRFWNRPDGFLAKIAPYSFGIYLIHSPIFVGIMFMLRHFCPMDGPPLPPPVMMVIVIGVTFVLSHMAVRFFFFCLNGIRHFR